MDEFSLSCRVDSYFSCRQSDRGAYVVWNVRDFSTLKRDRAKYKSPKFEFKDVLWYLSLYPRGGDNKSLGNVILLLIPCSSFPSKLNFTFSCQHESGANSQTEIALKDFSGDKGSGYYRYLSKDFLDGKCGNLIPDDILTIYCAITIVENSETEKGTSTDAENNSFLRKFHEAFNSGRFSDVVLRVGEETIPAHKLILSTHSEVFRGMFESDLKESQDNIVDLIDMDFTVAKAMLLYMYTREVEELSPGKILELYIAADKYMLTELKEKCREYVLNNMSSKIVGDVFEIANLHSDTILREATKKFFASNAKSILKTKEWREFSVEKPSSSVELLSFAIANNEFF